MSFGSLTISIETRKEEEEKFEWTLMTIWLIAIEVSVRAKLGNLLNHQYLSHMIFK